MHAADLVGAVEVGNRLLAVDASAAASGSAGLVSCVEDLPVGTDAGIAGEAFLVSVSVIAYGKRNPLIAKG